MRIKWQPIRRSQHSSNRTDMIAVVSLLLFSPVSSVNMPNMWSVRAGGQADEDSTPCKCIGDKQRAGRVSESERVSVVRWNEINPSEIESTTCRPRTHTHRQKCLQNRIQAVPNAHESNEKHWIIYEECLLRWFVGWWCALVCVSRLINTG